MEPLGHSKGESKYEAPFVPATEPRLRKRLQKQQQEEMKVRHFLMRYNFEGINMPMSGKRGGERFYPIHVAAQLGDYDLLRTLLRKGADPETPTASGGLALDMAKNYDFAGSHQRIADFLSTPVKILNVNSFKKLTADDCKLSL